MPGQPIDDPDERVLISVRRPYIGIPPVLEEGRIVVHPLTPTAGTPRDLQTRMQGDPTGGFPFDPEEDGTMGVIRYIDSVRASG